MADKGIMATGVMASTQLVITDVLDDLNVIGLFVLMNVVVDRLTPFIPAGIPMASEMVGAGRRIAEHVIFHRFATSKIKSILGV